MADPNIAWGKKTWDFLHAISLTYPPNADACMRTAMISMLKSLEGVIPCPKCRVHYGEWVVRTTVTDSTQAAFMGQENLFNALVDLHNEVNALKSTGSPPSPVSYVAAHSIHGQFAPTGSVCPSSTSTSALDASMRRLIGIAIVACVVACLIARRRPAKQEVP